MEIAADSQNCPHKSIDPKNEWCCLNCSAHFDLALEEVPIDDDIAISPSTPSQNPTQNPSEKDSSAESSPSTKDENDSTQESSNTESKGDSKESPNQPQEPQNLTLTSKAQITLAKTIYASLQEYSDYTKIQTSVIPIVESLQDYLARDFAKIS